MAGHFSEHVRGGVQERGGMGTENPKLDFGRISAQRAPDEDQVK